jgi:hypothetical protein
MEFAPGVETFLSRGKSTVLAAGVYDVTGGRIDQGDPSRPPRTSQTHGDPCPGPLDDHRGLAFDPGRDNPRGEPRLTGIIETPAPLEGGHQLELLLRGRPAHHGAGGDEDQVTLSEAALTRPHFILFRASERTVMGFPLARSS